MEESKNKVKLLKKILEVKKSVSYLQKAKHVGAVQFDYVSSDQVLGSVREKMNEIGLLIMPSITSAVLTQFVTKNGSPQFMTELNVVMTWVDVETGEEYPVPYYGQGVDNSEKGTGKAATYLEKYFILKSLNVPTASLDPDSFQQKHETEGQKEDKKAELIAELKVTNDLARVTEIWTANQQLKADKEFFAAVGVAGKRLKPAEEPAPAE